MSHIWWLDALRYVVVLEAAFTLGLTAAVIWSYFVRGQRILLRSAVELAFSFSILVGIAGFSELDRIGSHELGWYAPLKFVSLTVALFALTGLIRAKVKEARFPYPNE